MKAEIILEYAEKKIDQEELKKAAKKIWTDAGKKASDIKSLKLYVQPENNIVYFVINDDFDGSFAL